MTIIDISRTLNHALAPWPGDAPFRLQTAAARRQGDMVNLTTITTSAHIGSHVDAPYHFTDDGPPLHQLDLHIFWGPARVVTVHKKAGPLRPADFAAHNLAGVERLLVRSSASQQDGTAFIRDFVYPTPELVAFLGALGLILYGSDAPSMDPVGSEDLAGHRALWQRRIAILEGLDLSQAPDGDYELVALPLKIEGGDGSPVRAALRSGREE